jgi:hypothetical protein
MVKGAIENDHAFSVELDVAKLTEIGDRLLIEGYIGELIEVNFVEDVLEIKGVEANLKINLKEKEMHKLLKTKISGNRRPRL